MASLTLLSHNETTELSLQQHLEISPDLIAYPLQIATEADSEPLMMAQQVPHQATDKKRVKVYELRNNDWFDRGTGFCTASFTTVRPDSMPSQSSPSVARGHGAAHLGPAPDISIHLLTARCAQFSRPKMDAKTLA